MAIVYQLVPDAPILIAYNRDEMLERACPAPSIQSGKPRVLASIDPSTSGTCLGINQNGLFVSLIRRKKLELPPNPQSRGALCREMLKCTTAQTAMDLCLEELHSGQYEGVNFIVADSDSAWIIHSSDDTDVVELERGLSIVGENDLNDQRDERVNMARRLLTLQTLDSPVKFLAVASKVFARPPGLAGRPSMVMRNADFGTVSSTLISLGTKPRDAIYQYSNGSPDRTKFEDYSPFLRDILSRGLREARSKSSTTSKV